MSFWSVKWRTKEKQSFRPKKGYCEPSSVKRPAKSETPHLECPTGKKARLSKLKFSPVTVEMSSNMVPFPRYLSKLLKCVKSLLVTSLQDDTVIKVSSPR